MPAAFAAFSQSVAFVRWHHNGHRGSGSYAITTHL